MVPSTLGLEKAKSADMGHRLAKRIVAELEAKASAPSNSLEQAAGK